MSWSSKISGPPFNPQLSSPTYFLLSLRNKLCIQLGQESTGRWRKIGNQGSRDKGREEDCNGCVWVNPVVNLKLLIIYHTLGWWRKHSSGVRREKRCRELVSLWPCLGFFQAQLFLQQCLPGNSSSSKSTSVHLRWPSGSRWSSSVSHPLSNVRRHVYPKPRIHMLPRPRSNAHPRAHPYQPSRSVPQPSKPPRVNRSKDRPRYTCLPSRLPDAAFFSSCFSSLQPQLQDLLSSPTSSYPGSNEALSGFLPTEPFIPHTPFFPVLFSTQLWCSPRWTWVRPQPLQPPVWPQLWHHPCPKARK